MGKQGKIYGRPREQPVPNVSVGSFLLDKIHNGGDRVWLIDGCTGEQLTYREVLEKSVKFAKFLQTYGIKIGDRIAIASENRLNWVVPAYATFYLGAILTPINHNYTEWELRNILDISKPRLIFVSRRSEEIFVKILPSLSWPIELMQLDDKPLSPNIRYTLPNILKNEGTVDVLKYKTTDIDDISKHPAIILCSSGTTGMPKGVTLSHKNLLALLMELSKPDLCDIRTSDRFLLFLPFFHGYAVALLLTVNNGSSLVIMSAFEPEQFLRLVQEYKVSRLPIVPPILTFLAKHPLVERYDFRSVREITCGAAPLSKDIVAMVKLRLGVSSIVNGYGMTEMSMVTCTSSREGDDVNSLRQMVPGLLSKVVDLETRETLDAGQTGEICYKGAQVMLGYWNNPEVTEQTIDEDGWLHTGDIGYYDERDGLHVIDRLKELIKYKAYQVSPSEIETVLLSHPAVKDAAVTSKPDQRSGELPIAFVVRQPGATIAAEEIMEFVKKKLSSQKWLRGGVRFVDAIPKNPSGKILRREIRAQVAKL